MTRLVLTLYALLAASSALAHAPERCEPIIDAAMETLAPVLKHGLEAQERAWDGVENGWDNHRGDMLADTVFQLVPSVGELLTAIGELTTCINEDD